MSTNIRNAIVSCPHSQQYKNYIKHWLTITDIYSTVYNIPLEETNRPDIQELLTMKLNRASLFEKHLSSFPDKFTTYHSLTLMKISQSIITSCNTKLTVGKDLP